MSCNVRCLPCGLALGHSMVSTPVHRRRGIQNKSPVSTADRDFNGLRTHSEGCCESLLCFCDRQHSRSFSPWPTNERWFVAPRHRLKPCLFWWDDTQSIECRVAHGVSSMVPSVWIIDPCEFADFDHPTIVAASFLGASHCGDLAQQEPCAMGFRSVRELVVRVVPILCADQ